MDPALVCNGRVWVGRDCVDLLRGSNSLAGSLPIEYFLNSRLGRISYEYSRLVNLNSYRMAQLRAPGYAYNLDHTVFTALFSDAVTAGVSGGLVGPSINLVVTKSTFGGRFNHPLVNGWIPSDPMVGVSNLDLFYGDINQFISCAHSNRLAFQSSGDLLLKAGLIRPRLSIERYDVVGSRVEPFTIDFGSCEPTLSFLNDNAVLSHVNKKAWEIIAPLTTYERYGVSVILELEADYRDKNVSSLGFITRGFADSLAFI